MHVSPFCHNLKTLFKASSGGGRVGHAPLLLVPDSISNVTRFMETVPNRTLEVTR